MLGDLAFIPDLSLPHTNLALLSGSLCLARPFWFPPPLEHRLRLDYTGLVVRHPHRTRWPASSHHHQSPSSRAAAAAEPLNSSSNSSTTWAKFYPRLINSINSSSGPLEVLDSEELAAALALIYRSRTPHPSRLISLISKLTSI